MNIRNLLGGAAITLALLTAPASGAQITPNTALLIWTATGDDSLTGTASQYDLRYSTSAITAANFNAATRWNSIMVPRVAGSTDSALVTGLQPATNYWFALKIADEVPNWSGVSNILLVTTPALPDIEPPASPKDLRPKP